MLWTFFGAVGLHYSATFNFDSAKVCSAPIFETSFSITATVYYLYFYIIVLFPLTASLQLINFTASWLLVY